MNDRAGVDLVVTVDDLVHEGDGLGLGEGPFVGDGFGEVSSVAELGDDVGVVAGVVNVIDFYDVVTVFEVFEDIDFGGEQVLVDLAFDHAHIDDFDGYGLV